MTLNNILVPYCWPAFEGNIPKGTGKPFVVIQPLLPTTNTILGDLFTAKGLLNLALSGSLCGSVNRWLTRLTNAWKNRMERKLGSGWVWLMAFALALALLDRSRPDSLE